MKNEKEENKLNEIWERPEVTVLDVNTDSEAGLATNEDGDWTASS